MQGTVLPRMPARDVSGIVEDGPPNWIGAKVWGTGGDAGFTIRSSTASCARAEHHPSTQIGWSDCRAVEHRRRADRWRKPIHSRMTPRRVSRQPPDLSGRNPRTA
jgi:hypothetical protein